MPNKARRSQVLLGGDWRMMMAVPIIVSMIWMGRVAQDEQPNPLSGDTMASVTGKLRFEPNTASVPAVAGVQCGGPQSACLNPSETSADFLSKYGEHVYQKFTDMPVDLQANSLYWCFKAEKDFDLPCEIILAIWFGEESHQAQLCVLSSGKTVDCAEVAAADRSTIVRRYYGRAGAFKPLQTVTSTAGAIGPGQITPGFLHDNGHDLDENGVVDITSIADNIGTTAEGTLRNSRWANALVSRATRGTASFLPNVVTVMRMYNAGPSAMYPANVSAKTAQYADVGVRWITENQTWLLKVEQCTKNGGTLAGAESEAKIKSCLTSAQ